MKEDCGLEDTKSNDFYRHLFESVRDPIIIIRTDGLIIDANKALIEALRYSKEELLRMNVADLRSPADNLKVGEHLDKSYQGYSYETSYMRKDGKILPVEISAKGAMLGSEKVLFGVIRDITERKRAEETLRKTEEFNRRIIASSADCIKVLDLDGNLLYISEGGQRLLEITDVKRYHNTNFCKFWEEPDQANVRSAIAMARAGGTGTFQAYCPSEKGTPRWWDVIITPILGPDGTAELLLAVSRDISERKQAHEALRESEEKLRVLTDTATAAICILQDGQFQHVNNAIETITGYTRNELLSMDFLGLVHPGFRGYVTGLYSDWLIGRIRRARFETKIMRKDAAERWIDVSVNTIDYRGRPGLILTATDITDRKHLEKSATERNTELSHALETLETTINTMHVGVVIAEAGSEKILYYSPRALEIAGDTILGSATGPVSGKPSSITMLKPDGSVIPPDEWPLACALRRGETTLNEEIVIRHVNGREITTLINCTPIRDANGQIINAVASVVDITERKRAEESLKEAKQQTELYVDLMGHDINNLNQSAMGYLELALQQMDSEKILRLEDRLLIERPMQALASSSTLIENVRKLQKLMAEGVKTKPTDLDEIFRELEATTFHSKDRDIRIIIQHVPGSTVRANELLKDVFVNLIANAVKHSDEKKPLTIEVKVEPFNENGQRNYRCLVEDDGPGIPDELKSRLFHRFQRGATRAYGKGLGLYLVRTLVEGYHGKVWVEDRVPDDYTKGAKFVVILTAA